MFKNIIRLIIFSLLFITILPKSVMANIIVDYRLDECSGSTVYDHSVNAINATAASGATVITDGWINNGKKFDGSTTGYVDIPEDSKLVNMNSAFTISFWMKATDVNNWQGLVSNIYFYGLLLVIDPNNANHVGMYVYDSNGKGSYIGVTENIYADTWYHITYTYDNFTYESKLYCDTINSVEDSPAVINNQRLDFEAGENFNLGSYYSGYHVDRMYTGRLDEVKFFDKVLTASEIETIYNNEKTRYINYSGDHRNGWSINDVSITEGDYGTKDVTISYSLNHPAPCNGVSVNYSLSNGSAIEGEDYNTKSGTLSLASGETSGTVTLSGVIIGDIKEEGSETFTINLSSPDHSSIIDGQATITITNDDDESDYFITTWHTLSSNENITIPTTGSGYDYVIDWGDGSATEHKTDDTPPSHTYTSSGDYTIQIKGDFPCIYFNNSGDKDKIISIDQWGVSAWSTMNNAFYGCINLAGQATDSPNLSNVTNMRSMFYSATKFNQDIGDWNVSKVTDMYGLFAYASSFNQYIGDWNVSNVTDMQSMFLKSTFNQDIGDWNVSNVTDMQGLFAYASSFNQYIGDWNVSNVTDMQGMFYSATNFNQDIGDWNVSKVTAMTDMFNSVTLSTLNYDKLLIGWNALDLINDVVFSGGNSRYCLGESARTAKLGDNWTITDSSILDCSIYDAVAEYRFDSCTWDGTISEVIDTSTNSYHGTTVAGTILQAGKINNGAEFDGVDDYIKQDAIYTHLKTTSTLTFWIKTNSAGSNTVWEAPGVLGIEDASGPDDIFWGWIDAIGHIGITAKGGTNVLSTTSINDDTWHHIALTRDAISGECNIYIDGSLETTATSGVGDILNTFNKIGSIEDTGGTPTFFQGRLDELKVFSIVLPESKILDIYNNENAGRDYNNNTTIRSNVTCSQAIFNAVNQANGCFNWDNNITTKIAGSSILLTILSADENDNNHSLLDTNITKLELLSFSDATCNTLYNTTQVWSGNQDVNSSACFNPTSYTHNKAVKCAKIKITGIYEGKVIESNSSDTFSIRPEKFTLTPALDTKLTSEHAYTFQVQALNYQSDIQTPDFNQTLATPTSTLYFREGSENNGSLEGALSLTPNDLSFSDGLTGAGELNFNNVGLVTLDINDTTWAEVDSDDTPEIDRTIHMKHNLTFIPDHFDVTFTSPTMSNHLDGSFTYLSNDLNMSAWLKNLSAHLSARGEQGGLMTNYETPQSNFYANNIDITTSLSVLNTPSMLTTPLSKSNALLNFVAGEVDINYDDVRFNYTRDFKVPSDPIMIAGSDANITIQISDHIDTSVTGKKVSSFTGSAAFYYGKIVNKDVKTGEDSVPSGSFVEIYSTTILTGFERETSRWYINKEDDFSEILNLVAKETRDISSNTSSYTSAQNLLTSNKGQITYDLLNTHDNSYKAFYHLEIKNWLWHNKYNNYNASSNCSEHPCFEYIYESGNTNITGIKSGNMGNSSFANDFNTSHKRKAIKLLR